VFEWAKGLTVFCHIGASSIDDLSKIKNVQFIFPKSTLKKLLNSKFSGFLRHSLIFYSILKFTMKDKKLFEKGVSFLKFSLTPFFLSLSFFLSFYKILLREREDSPRKDSNLF
jgi:hypothetical protein